MPALPFVQKIHDSSNKDVRFAALITRFGDGYGQRAPDGLNAKKDLFNITWKALSVAEKDVLTGVLNGVGNWGILTWKPPAESQTNKFVMPKDTGYSIEYVGKRFNISCQLEQVFDL